MTCNCTTNEKADCQCPPLSKQWTEEEIRQIVRDELAERFKGGVIPNQPRIVGEKPSVTFAINVNGKHIIV